MMRRGGAHGINAGQDRTDRAIDNRIRRDDGGGVDDVTHGSPPPALARKKQKGMKQTRNHDGAVYSQFKVIGHLVADSPVRELEYYLDKGGGATLVQPAPDLFDRSRH